VLSFLSRQRRLNPRKNAALDFVDDMDNSMCHNARKIAEELRGNKIQRAPHPPYSYYISSHLTFGCRTLKRAPERARRMNSKINLGRRR
jgi:hypothetical protein